MQPVKLNEKEVADLVGYLRTIRIPRRGEIAPLEVDVELANSQKLRGVSVNRTFEDMQVRTADGRRHLCAALPAARGTISRSHFAFRLAFLWWRTEGPKIQDVR
jgi:hypothetical protein